MHARGIFSAVSFKKLVQQSLFCTTIFIIFAILSLIVPEFVFAQGPPDHIVSEHALDNFPFAFEHKEAALQPEASEVAVPGELLVKF
jgi:hypothetical protein